MASPPWTGTAHFPLAFGHLLQGPCVTSTLWGLSCVSARSTWPFSGFALYLGHPFFWRLSNGPHSTTFHYLILLIGRVAVYPKSAPLVSVNLWHCAPEGDWLLQLQDCMGAPALPFSALCGISRAHSLAEGLGLPQEGCCSPLWGPRPSMRGYSQPPMHVPCVQRMFITEDTSTSTGPGTPLKENL